MSRTCPGRCKGKRLFRASVHLLGIAAVCAVLLGLPALAEQRAIKSKVAPVYPEIAKRLHVTGIVKLEVTIDADGKVTAVKTTSGNHMLAVAAEEAVQKWKFASGPGETTMDLDVNFDLNQ
jgi:TonB family protein